MRPTASRATAGRPSSSFRFRASPGRSRSRADPHERPAWYGRAVELGRALDFIREHHHAVMQTYRRDGTPQLSPIACGVDADGLVVVSTRETALKAKNLRRDPRVSLCVISDGFFGEWIQLDGRAEIVALPDAMEHLVEYYRT